MSARYPIKRTANVSQLETDTTFCGGIPKLPTSLALPKCKLCGSDLTFYFQIKFPIAHRWEGSSCAVFACTECVDEDHFIPPMITGQLKGGVIPDGFLKSYQVNFAVHVFSDKDAILRRDYIKLDIKFERWNIDTPDVNSAVQSFINGVPSWLQEDETPSLYDDSIGLCFLMQIEENFQFPIEAGAPHQMTLGLDRKPRRSKNDFYKLFIGNQIYFFGTLNNESDRAVYIITQRS